MQLPPFTLYGLLGCSHCEQAEQFLRARNIPASLVIGNNDPIVAAGIKEVTGTDEYPVLVSRISSEVIKGFKPDQYERVAKIYFDSIRPSAPNIFGSGQQPGAEVAGPEAAKSA